ncbi:hypothetical protein TrVFT333_011694 [Trichoderma virens FT-333]|nr:hypothetical protein TrVFT333_011694 [Trichoderma virens FT-333]
MADLWDYVSRLETTTRTDDGAYDQVLAVSQGLINDHFEALFDLYKGELSKLYFKDPAIGTFEGTLQAPKVLIPGADEPSANLNEVLLLVRFDDGSLKSADGKTEIEDLKHWTFAVRVPVVPEAVPDPSTITDPKKRKRAEEKRQRIRERFDHPGDYTVERLYMKLSSANWNSLDNERSVAGLDSEGKPVPYWEWKSDEDNVSTARRLALWLGEWADSFERDAHNSLGLSFKPPTINSVMPSYGTFFTRSISTRASPMVQRTAKQVSGVLETATVCCTSRWSKGGVKPSEPRLLWSGNFATQPSPNNPAVNATFLLNHQIFFGKYLLPEFRSLNQAIDVYHYKFYWEVKKPTDNWPLYQPWVIGYDPNYPSVNDSKYDYTPIYDPKNAHKVISYQWNKVNEQPLRVEKKPGKSYWGRAKTKDTMNTTLRWDTGNAELTLSGTTIVDEFEEWTHTEDAWDNPTSYNYDKYTVEWSIKMRIVPENDTNLVSHLNIVVDPPPPGKSSYVQVTPEHNPYNMKTLDHTAVLTEDITTRMTRELDRIIGNIRKHLKAAGRFTYPGSGTLIFEDAVIGRYGDLNAKVRYAKLKHKDWIIKVPRVESGQPPKFVEVKPKIKTAQPLISSHSLSWSTSPIRALQPDQTLTIHGVNNTTEAVRFAALTLGFRSGKVKDCIFTTSDYEYQENKPPAPPSEKETEKEKEKETDKDTDKTTAGTESHGYLSKLKDRLTGSGSRSDSNPPPKKGIVKISRSDDRQDVGASPNAWVEVSVTAETAFAQMHPVSINESIRNDKGKDIGHFDQPIVVRVS